MVLLVIGTLFQVISAFGQSEGRVLRVGVYQNAPQVFIAKDGSPRGIYVDILKEIARLEGWKLEFVEGSFTEGLQAVQEGRLDIMTSIAATPDRLKTMDFSKETIVSVWAQLYVRPGFDPQNILDMAGKTVTVMESGILGAGFGKLCKDFDVDCNIVSVVSYDDALQAVHDEKADGAVVNSILGYSRESRYRVVRSSIIFNPFRLQVALPKGQNQDIAAKIDEYLRAWRGTKNSFYFQTLDHWLGLKPEEAQVVPIWVWVMLAGGGGVAVLFFYWIAILRREVKQRQIAETKLSESTHELQKNERRLDLLLELSKAAPKLNEKELLERSLDIAVEVTDSQVGYLHLVNDDQETLTLSTWNKTTLEFCTAAYQDHYPITEAGIWADSFRKMRPVMHNDYQNEKGKKGYPEGHFHLVRHMSAPVTDGVRVSLLIGVGNKETDYTEKDVVALQAVANDIEKMVMRQRSQIKIRKANDLIRQSEEKYRAIFKTSKVGMAMCQMDGSLIEFNQGFLDVVGYTEEEAKKLTYWELTPKEYEDSEAAQLKSLEETGSYGPYEKEYIRNDGSRVPVLLNGAIVTDNEGNRKIWSIVQDISERKQAERDIKEAMLTAENANKAKSEFLANMSHELRTPLNSIIGFSEMMEYEIKGPLPDTYREYSNLITSSGRLLLETVNSILDLAKIEAGKFELHTETVFMEPIVDDVLSLVNNHAKGKGIKLLNQTEEMHELNVDPMRIKQVLLNLLSNAIKFTDQGEIRITNHCDANGHNISVTDSGIGMSEEQIQIALKPFRQVHGTSLSRKYQGTGLGLSLSRQILELHGGKLEISSEIGKGTVVTLHFPPGSAA